MTYIPKSPFLQRLRGRITLEHIPFSDAGSRLLVFSKNSQLLIRLAERWGKWQDEVGHYRQRPPMIDEWLLLDENGAPLDIELTAYPHALDCETRRGSFWLAFEDEETLYVKLPPGCLGLSFRVYAARGHADRRGGEFKGDPEHRRTHRNVAYTTNARIVSNTVEPDENGYARVRLQVEADAESAFMLNVTPRLGFKRSVPEAAPVFAAAEQRWHDWFARVPCVAEKYQDQYYYAWWILRAGLLSPRFFLTHPAMMPSMIHYVGVWQWDAYFHALAYKYVDQRLAEDQLRVVLDHQREDGMIPDAVHDEGIVTEIELPGSTQKGEVTKPPLIAWTALQLHAASGHRDFLDEIYEPVVRLNRWWFDKNDSDHDGIVQYNHPFSSGLDDNPLWDQGMPVESPDINTYLVLELESLAKIAEVLGLPDDARRWQADADQLAQRMISHFWDERAGVFWALHNHIPIPVLTPFNLYPLLTGRLPRVMADRVVAHLRSPDEFWLKYPIPSVARNDPKFDLNQMWRGPTWVNINHLFVAGLRRCGYVDLARALRERTLELLMTQNDIYEYYNPETGVPPPHAASVFGWSSAVFIDLAIQASQSETL
jgi:Mannosylglycerate hydrolase MGH1-like glycoside hydrolase domain